MEIRIYDLKFSHNIYYRVESGDTLDGLSSLFNVPKDYIVLHNGQELYAGKLLFLPETNFAVYVVKPFDTLEKIAKHFGTTPENIKQKNSLMSDYVFVGQKLYV